MVQGHLATKLVWRALREAYEPLRGAPERVDAELLRGVEETIREVLAGMPAFASRCFALPDGLKAFYLVAQDRLAPRRDGTGFRFYACTWLVTDGLHFADEARGDSTPWLEIGCFDERSWAFICCDTEHALFGAVVERTDATPWSQTVWESEVYPDMEAFLRSLL